MDEPVSAMTPNETITVEQHTAVPTSVSEGPIDETISRENDTTKQMLPGVDKAAENNATDNNQSEETQGEQTEVIIFDKDVALEKTFDHVDVTTTNGELNLVAPSKVRFENDIVDDQKNINEVDGSDKGDVTNGAAATASNASDTSLGTPSSLADKKSHEEKKKSLIQSGHDLKVSERALEDSANCVSVWLLSYLTPLLRLGSHKLLDQDDVGVPPDQDRAERVYKLTYDVWQKQASLCREHNKKQNELYKKTLDECGDDPVKRAKLLAKPPVDKEPSIASCIVTAFGVWSIILSIIYYIISALLGFVPVLILNDLVKFFQSTKSVDEWDGYAHPWIEVVALGVVPILVSLLQTRNQVIMSHCAVFVRTAVSTMLYRKALRVSAAGRAKTSTGQVVNMMSNDTAQLQRFLQFVGMTLVAPLQIIIALILIYQQVSVLGTSPRVSFTMSYT
jgi:ABC transporter transmembrane region